MYSSLYFFIIFFVATVFCGLIWLRVSRKFGIVEQCDKRYRHKQGTSTLGGIIMLLPLWGILLLDFNLVYLTILIFASLVFLSGLLDDLTKIKRRNNLGLLPKQKLALHFVCGLVFSILFYFTASKSIPYLFFNAIYFVFFVNSLNITDGLDGLAIGNYIFALIFLLFAFYFYKNSVLFLFVLILLAVCFGFALFNFYPSKLFMGDAGASMLGSLLAMLAITGKVKYLIFVAALVIVLDGLSSPVQLISKRYLKTRVIPSAPLHRTFLILGFSEQQVVYVSWVISALLVIAAIFLVYYF